jgi:uncharacterized protein (DUF169 family)
MPFSPPNPDPASAQSLLGLEKPPVAVAFSAAPPPGVERWSGGPMPAGCSFWQRAMAGEAFYTLPADHLNCAVGSYTHQIDLPAERAHELQDTVHFMVTNRYLDLSEVPGIPRLPVAPGAVAYAPIDHARFDPDVVILAVKPSQAMLVYEAALKAGAGDALASTLGRPGCALLPLVHTSGRTALSFGCKGNRTFTGTPDEELYVAVPGPAWPKVIEKLAEVLEANAVMGDYYAAQKSKFAGSAGR